MKDSFKAFIIALLVILIQVGISEMIGSTLELGVLDIVILYFVIVCVIKLEKVENRND